MAETVQAIGFNRDAMGRGWSDVLDNQVAIMQALLLMPEMRHEKSFDVQQGLRFRISETAKFLSTALPSS